MVYYYNESNPVNDLREAAKNVLSFCDYITESLKDQTPTMITKVPSNISRLKGSYRINPNDFGQGLIGKNDNIKHDNLFGIHKKPQNTRVNEFPDVTDTYDPAHIIGYYIYDSLRTIDGAKILMYKFDPNYSQGNANYAKAVLDYWVGKFDIIAQLIYSVILEGKYSYDDCAKNKIGIVAKSGLMWISYDNHGYGQYMVCDTLCNAQPTGGEDIIVRFYVELDTGKIHYAYVKNAKWPLYKY